MTSLKETVLEKLKYTPLEFEYLKSRHIDTVTPDSYTILFKHCKSDQRFVKFEDHCSVYNEDFIKIYNRIQNKQGCCFVRNSDNSNEFTYYHEPFSSTIITRDCIPVEVLDIFLMLNVTIISKPIHFLVSDQTIEQVLKLVFN